MFFETAMPGWLLVVLCLAATNGDATNPGLRLRVSQPGLNYGASIAIDILAKQVLKFNLPDQHGSANINVGDVKYDVTQMKITDFVRPSTDVMLSPGGLKWTVSNAAVSLHGNWHYKYQLAFITIQDQGSFDGRATGVSVSVSAVIGEDSTGRPTISTTGCWSSIGGISIDLHGGASWLYDIFIGFVEEPLRGVLNGLICESARKAIDESARQQLATLMVQIGLGNDCMLDYRLVAPPSISDQYLESYHKGEFFLKSDQTEAPFQAALIPPTPPNQRMVSICMSDYVLNTAGYVFYKQGLLKYQLTNKDLDEAGKAYLETSCDKSKICLGKLIPQLGTSFPNAAVELQLAVSERPTAAARQSGVEGRFVGDVIYSARLVNGSSVYLFKTKLEMMLKLSVFIEGATAKAAVTSFDPNVTVIDSAIGPVSTSAIQWLVKAVGKLFIVPKLNQVGARGFPLPSMEDVQFVNSDLTLENGYITLTTDIKYTPATSNTLYFKSQNYQ